jgi:hypothetical protein
MKQDVDAISSDLLATSPPHLATFHPFLLSLNTLRLGILFAEEDQVGSVRLFGGAEKDVT